MTPAKKKANYWIETMKLGSGWAAVMLWDGDGYAEPYQTGVGRYEFEGEAIQEADGWAEAEGVSRTAPGVEPEKRSWLSWVLVILATPILFPFYFVRNVWRRLNRPPEDRAPEHDFMECPVCIHGEPFCSEGRAYMDHPSRHAKP